MKWFFLTFIALFAVTGNAAFFESLSLGRVFGGVAFNLFVLSLAIIWWASYFSSTQAQARLLVIGDATLMLSAGAAVVANGVKAALENSCEHWIFDNGRNGLLGRLVNHLQSLDYCREFGFGFIFLGLFVTYPSVRLFIGIKCRPGGDAIGGR